MKKKDSPAVLLVKSKSKEQILRGIDLFRLDGKIDELEEIFVMMSNSEDEDIIHKASLLLSDIKDPAAVNLFVQAIKNKNFHSIQKTIVMACWQTGLDFSKYLGVFNELVREADLETGIEALTVVENFAENVDPESIELEINATRKFIDKGKSGHNILAVELLKVLEQMKRDKS